MNTLFIFHIILFVCDGLSPIGFATYRQGVKSHGVGNVVKRGKRVRTYAPPHVCACAGGRARIRERKLPESPAYWGFLLYDTLKSQCGITVPHCLCGKSASKRAVFRVE